MKVELNPVGRHERAVLERLLQLYLHDFSEIDGAALEDDGRFSYPYLTDYWMDPSREALLLRVDGRLAGFALVNRDAVLPPASGALAARVVAEFFVARAHRRRGTGRAAARALLRARPGAWEVREIAANAPAQAFWRAVIAEVADGGACEEAWLDDERWRGPVQRFVVSSSACET